MSHRRVYLFDHHGLVVLVQLLLLLLLVLSVVKVNRTPIVSRVLVHFQDELALVLLGLVTGVLPGV